MAIYIQINKLEDFGEAVLYEFGPVEEIVGAVGVQKATGEVSLIEIEEQRDSEFYLSRIETVLSRHARNGEFPDRAGQNHRRRCVR